VSNRVLLSTRCGKHKVLTFKQFNIASIQNSASKCRISCSAAIEGTPHAASLGDRPNWVLTASGSKEEGGEQDAEWTYTIANRIAQKKRWTD